MALSPVQLPPILLICGMLACETRDENLFFFCSLPHYLTAFSLLQHSITNALYYIFMGWFSSSVTVRELILRANGSRIRTWWLVHHYGVIATAAVMLLWLVPWLDRSALFLFI